jgi:hypothetical protein
MQNIFIMLPGQVGAKQYGQRSALHGSGKTIGKIRTIGKGRYDLFSELDTNIF